jgi:peptide/nickel transport system permease protein
VIAFGMAGAILAESTLSFLGLGSGDVTWGTLLSKGRNYLSYWWLTVLPGLAIFLTVTFFNLIGDGLSEALK